MNGQQVQCSGGYYGVHREYNAEGQNISLTFLDKSGHAICISSNCAGVTYQRDGNGTVVGEQYFDTDGKPVRSSLGQYGELYQRNEQGYIGQITYLGADGKTTPTNAGYTMCDRLDAPHSIEALTFDDQILFSRAARMLAERIYKDSKYNWNKILTANRESIVSVAGTVRDDMERRNTKIINFLIQTYPAKNQPELVECLQSFVL